MKEKKKNKKQRRIFLLLLLMIGTGTIFGTATYAWFTANKTVSVNPIDVNVQAQSGLQISADGQNWKSTLTLDDLTGASNNYPAAANQIPTELEPVSTAGVVSDAGRLNMYLGVVSADDEGNWTLTSTATPTEAHTTTSGYFVAYDMFVRYEGATTPIYLTTNSGVVFNDADNRGIQNAARVAFLTLGHTTSDDTIPKIQGLNDGASSPVTIWEPNYDTHTSYGVANARDVYGIDDLTAGDGNEAVAYDGIKAPFSNVDGLTLGNANATTYGEYFQTVTPGLQTVADFDAYQELMNIEAGVTKIRVYLWIEGQDVDCENNASGSNVTFNLQLSTNSSAN